MVDPRCRLSITTHRGGLVLGFCRIPTGLFPSDVPQRGALGKGDRNESESNLFCSEYRSSWVDEWWVREALSRTERKVCSCGCQYQSALLARGSGWPDGHRKKRGRKGGFRRPDFVLSSRRTHCISTSRFTEPVRNFGLCYGS